MCDIQLRHQLYSSNFFADLFKHSSFKNITDFHFIQNINYSYYKLTVPFLTFAIAAQGTRFSRPEINILRISSNFTDGRNHWRQPRRGRRGHIPPILLHTFGYSRPILVALRSLSLKPISFGYKTPPVRFSQAGGQSAHKARPPPTLNSR